MTIPAAWLPLAAQAVTVVWTHPEYDATAQRVMVARDWRDRGEDYIRRIADLDSDTVVLAVFEGRHDSKLGAAVNA